eukprot:COSAG05_NODE_2812_length_2613_cov_2.861575_2_plen_715_part_00
MCRQLVSLAKLAHGCGPPTHTACKAFGKAEASGLKLREKMAAHGSGRATAGFARRLPAIPAARAPAERRHAAEPAVSTMSSVAGSSKPEVSQQHWAGSDALIGMIERMRAEHREDVHKLLELLAKKDEQHREDLRKKDEQHREDMHKLLDKKDELLTKKDGQHHEDRCKKDEQLERLVQQLSSGAAAGTMPFPVSLHQPMPPAVPAVPPPAAPSPPQARRMQPDAAGQDQSQQISISSSASVPTDDWVALLQAGGDEVEAALTAVLESALETLEAVLVLTPRKQRKTVKAQCERTEEILEELSGQVVGRLASCQAEELRVLGEKFGAVQALRATGETDMGCMNAVEEAVEELEKCSNVVVGSSRQLASTQNHVRRLGLEALAGLSQTVLEQSVVAEVEAAALVLAVAMDEGKADGERATSLLGLFVLGLRNAAAAADVLVQQLAAHAPIVSEVCDGRLQGREGAAMQVNSIACEFLGLEIAFKCGAAVRGPLEKAYIGFLAALVKEVSCSKARYQELLPLYLEATESDDAVVASAACLAICQVVANSSTGKECVGTCLSCDPARVVWGNWKRLIEPGTSVTRWRLLAQELSVESVCLAAAGCSLHNVSGVTATRGGIPHDGVGPELVAEAAHMLQVNCDSKLSAQDRFSFFTFFWAASLAGYATQDSAHHPGLLPCAEALLWAAVHGSFPFIGIDFAVCEYHFSFSVPRGAIRS